MKTTPILFSPVMAEAIRTGQKTETRRPVKPIGRDGGFVLMPKLGGLWPYRSADGETTDDGHGGQTPFNSPYGMEGDRLCLLTTWATEKQFDERKPSDLPTDARIWSYFDGPNLPPWCGRRRPGRFAPTWLRDRMPMADVRSIHVEPLQSIDHGGALREGIKASHWAWRPLPLRQNVLTLSVLAYSHLWDEINGPGEWDRNPWVWVIRFGYPT